MNAERRKVWNCQYHSINFKEELVSSFGDLGFTEIPSEFSIIFNLSTSSYVLVFHHSLCERWPWWCPLNSPHLAQLHKFQTRYEIRGFISLQLFSFTYTHFYLLHKKDWVFKILNIFIHCRGLSCTSPDSCSGCVSRNVSWMLAQPPITQKPLHYSNHLDGCHQN